jgi:3',5'-cyclic AMP phosphodiesterase CpdA
VASTPQLFAISDLHVGHPGNRDFIQRHLVTDNRDDWLLVPGDVSEDSRDIAWCLELLSQRFRRVIWTPGNHDLFTVPQDPAPFRGDARYRYLVDLCRSLGVLTPEDRPVLWEGATPSMIVPLFTHYDFSFLPPGARTTDQGLAQARRHGVVPTDQRLLQTDPYPSHQAWCDARIAYSRQVLESVDRHYPIIAVNHYPLVSKPIFLPRIPEYIMWCGTTQTAKWAKRYRISTVVYGHLHAPGRSQFKGVRYEEVSLGYPRQWKRRWRRPGLRLID